MNLENCLNEKIGYSVMDCFNDLNYRTNGSKCIEIELMKRDFYRFQQMPNFQCKILGDSI